MTTEQLRKVIIVTGWNLNQTGLTVSYEREDSSPKQLHLILNKEETIRELYLVGSIDDVGTMGTTCIIGELWYGYSEMASAYKMCQWEALSIAIRHEAEKELNNDMDMLELDSAINALK